MKNKSLSILLTISLFCLSLFAKANNDVPAEFYLGKWAMQFKNLPQGDGKLTFSIEKKDTAFVGQVLDGAGNKVAGIDKIEMAAENMTLYFSAGGFDVSVVVTKKDDTHVTASLMNMFEGEGEKVKEEKATK
jgi:hypothetical protein